MMAVPIVTASAMRHIHNMEIGRVRRKNIVVASDYKEREFGLKYGFLIDELKLLARGIVVIDKDDTIRYVEYVSEVTNHVDYDRAIEEAKKLI